MSLFRAAKYVIMVAAAGKIRGTRKGEAYNVYNGRYPGSGYGGRKCDLR